MKSSLKVFIMSVIGFLVTTLSTLEDFNFWYVVITTVVFASGYAVKNYLMPSDSAEGVVNWKNILSGLIIAVNMALSNLAAILLTGSEFSFHVFWITVVGAVVGYFTKTIPQGEQLKKAGMIIVLLLIVGTVNAQGPWSGFFKSTTAETVNQKISEKEIQLRTDAEVVSSESAWFFRPTVTLTAVAVDFSTKPVTTKSLSSVGMGISYGKFSVVNEKDYCNYSINALLLTGVALNDEMSTRIGGALTVDVFNKLIGFGAGYLDKSFMLLTTISYSF